MNRIVGACLPLGALLLAEVLASGCGYHVAGHANALPAHVNSIAVLPFSSSTVQYGVAERFTAAVKQELIQRTRYQITSDPITADAVLKGAVVNTFSSPTTIDATTGRASAVQIIVILQISLKERVSGKVLFDQPNFQVRERYEISVDPKTYFDESGGAIDRLSRDIARTVVSGILEKF